MGWCPSSSWCSRSWTRIRRRSAHKTKCYDDQYVNSDRSGDNLDHARDDSDHARDDSDHARDDSDHARTTATVTGPETTLTAPGTTVTMPGTTATVTAPPPTLSYVPPLSPVVQTKVDGIVAGLMAKHQGESTQVTYCHNSGCHMACIVKTRVKNGVITAIEPDDSVNAGVPREDTALGLNAVKQGMIQARGCTVPYAIRKEIYDPESSTLSISESWPKRQREVAENRLGHGFELGSNCDCHCHKPIWATINPS